MDMQKKLLKPMLYIVYFLVGTILFLYMTNSIKVPIYKTLEGTVNISDEEVLLEIKDYNEESLPEQIYYYVNRDEWVESVTDYDSSKGGYIIDNVHKLKDKTIVKIDIEARQMTLFEIIFREGGNV